MSKTFPKVYLECFAHISADSQPFWLKIGPLEKSRVSGPLPVPVPAVTHTPNPQGLRNPCHSLIIPLVFGANHAEMSTLRVYRRDLTNKGKTTCFRVTLKSFRGPYTHVPFCK